MGNKRWILTSITLLVILGFIGFFFWQSGADKHIIDRLLPKIESRYNVKIAFDDIHVSLSTVRLKNVIVQPTDKSGTFARIDTLGVNVRVGPLLLGELDITGLRVEGITTLVGTKQNGVEISRWRELMQLLMPKTERDTAEKRPLKVPDIYIDKGKVLFDDGVFSAVVSDFSGRVTPGDKAVINAKNWRVSGMPLFGIEGNVLDVTYDFGLNHLDVEVHEPTFELPVSPVDFGKLAQDVRTSLNSMGILHSTDKTKDSPAETNANFLDAIVKVSSANGRLVSSQGPVALKLSGINAELMTNNTEVLFLRASGRSAGSETRWALQGGIPRTGTSSLMVEIPHLSLRHVGPFLWQSPVVDIADASINTQFKIVWGNPEVASGVEGQATLSGITINHEKVADTPLTEISGTVDFNLGVDTDERQILINNLAISRNMTRFVVDGTVSLDRTAFSLNLAIPPTACRQLLGAFPAPLRNELTGVSLEGQLSLGLFLSLDMEDPDALQLDGSLDNRCKISRFGDIPHPDDFRRPFAYVAWDQNGKKLRLTTGPGTNRWVPLSQISPFLIQALLTTEDGKFDRHRGMTLPEVEAALKKNIEKGGMYHGASTLTMQLAKNLFLSRERTIARKLQELFFTWYLESNFTKDEILELYLNVVEFGPSLYGVGEAAMLYFGRNPGELNLAESVFLIKLLPNPVERFKVYESGQVGERQMKSLHRVMAIMKKRQRISESEYNAGITQEIVFYKEGDPLPEPRIPLHRERMDALDDPDSHALDDDQLDEAW